MEGFEPRQAPQRVMSPGGMPVDIVPFGDIADENSNIRWPPSGEVEMDVTGFEEAHNSAIQVIVKENSEIQVPVASPPGLALLKLIAWSDRPADLRMKDAQDFAYILGSYEHVDSVTDRLYDVDGLMEGYNWELEAGCAHLLGLDTVAIAGEKTRAHIESVIARNFQDEQPNLLAEEMCMRLDEEYDDMLGRLKAFSNGFHS